MAESVTLKISLEQVNKIKEYYSSFEVTSNGEYVIFTAKKDNLIITIYSSKKGYKVLFSGENSLNEAKLFDESAQINVKKEKVKSEWLDYYSQIGSDEVGTGDFFGPIIVVASYCDTNTIKYLKEIGVDDSKKMTDQKILEIVPKFINKVIYSRLTCTPIKYNEMIKKGYSMNSLKAILHNEALHNVKDKVKQNVNIYIDQFCEPRLYYSYLNGFSEPLINNVHFKTKGESYYPSVAASSLIARYAFLKYFEELNKKYNLEFPLGASKKVDEFFNKLKEKVSSEELETLVKTNFKNYQK